MGQRLASIGLVALVTLFFVFPHSSVIADEQATVNSSSPFSAEVARVVQAIRKAMWGKTRAIYMEQTIKASLPFVGEKVMKGRGWTKLPNKSRFEVIEPADLASTFIANGRKVMYINNKGEAWRPNPQQRAQSSYQQDFSQFFEEFDLTLYTRA